jgi:hypothetical protein
MRKFVTTLATAGLAIVALPAAANADISLKSFEISPSCVTPGSAVQARVSVRQNHWYHVHPLWTRVQIRQAQSGVVLSQSDDGPRWIPFGDYEETRTEVVPANAAPGDYTVNLLLGSSLGGSEWGKGSRPLRVRQLAFLCSV